MGMCLGTPGKKLKPDWGKKPLFVAIVGDGGVGKTAILNRYMNDNFDQDYNPTIFDDYEGPVNVDDKPGKIMLRDTAGQEQYDAINDASFTDIDIFIICFALSKARETTLENVQAKWMQNLRQNNHLKNGAKVFLVGTQMDLPDDKLSKTSDAKAQSIAQEISAVKYIKTSSFLPRDQGNIPVLFEEVVRAGMYVD